MQFPLVEMHIQKYATSSVEQKKEGKSVTKHYLMTAEHFTKPWTQVDMQYSFVTICVFARAL